MTFYKLGWHLKDFLLHTSLQARDFSLPAGSLLPWRKSVSILAVNWQQLHSFTLWQQQDDALYLLNSFLQPWSHCGKQCLPKCAIITHSARQAFFCFTGCYSYRFFLFIYFSLTAFWITSSDFFFLFTPALSHSFQTDFDTKPEKEE